MHILRFPVQTHNRTSINVRGRYPHMCSRRWIPPRAIRRSRKRNVTSQVCDGPKDNLVPSGARHRSDPLLIRNPLASAHSHPLSAHVHPPWSTGTPPRRSPRMQVRALPCMRAYIHPPYRASPRLPQCHSTNSCTSCWGCTCSYPHPPMHGPKTADAVLFVSWEWFTSLDFDWDFIQGTRKFRWPMVSVSFGVEPRWTLTVASGQIFYFLNRYCLLFSLIGM
jgi:hypothetical protein